ncbi:MAG: tetratricopeptide repeat protein [Bacteroidetes bacterium]|nr:tetratricopeptide repeat protein [Bacteroidota bacterium]
MLGLYVWKLVLPINLSFDLSYPQVSPAKVSDLSFIISAIVLSAILVSAVMGFRKRSLLSASLFIFFVTASVSSNIFMLIGTHYGERLMYAPSFGLCLAVSSVLVSRLGGEKSIGKLSPGLSAIAIVLVGAFSILTILRNPVWKDNTTLYASGIVSAPNSARVHYYQGLLLVKPETIASYPESSRDSVEKAGIYHLKKSVGLYAPFADAWTQLGVAYYRKKNFKESLQYYDEALKYNKYDPVVYNNSGSVYFEMQNFNEALKRYTEAVRLKPDYADAYMNIGSCYGVAGQYDQALVYLEKAVFYDPKLAQAYYMIGVTWKNKGNEQMANQYFQKAEMAKVKK